MHDCLDSVLNPFVCTVVLFTLQDLKENCSIIAFVTNISSNWFDSYILSDVTQILLPLRPIFS